MTPQNFATVSIRILGVAAILFGVIFAGESLVKRALDMPSLTSSSTSDAQLDDTYYVISHFEDAWLVPGTIGVLSGILLLVMSRRLGTWLARGTDLES